MPCHTASMQNRREGFGRRSVTFQSVIALARQRLGGIQRRCEGRCAIDTQQPRRNGRIHCVGFEQRDSAPPEAGARKSRAVTTRLAAQQLYIASSSTLLTSYRSRRLICDASISAPTFCKSPPLNAVTVSAPVHSR